MLIKGYNKEEKRTILAFIAMAAIFAVLFLIAIGFQKNNAQNVLKPRNSVFNPTNTGRQPIKREPVPDGIKNQKININKHNYDYESETKYVKSVFANETNGSSLAAVKMNSYSVDWQILNTNDSKAQINGRQVIYPNVFDKVDLRYTANDKSLKEEFILRDATINKFSITLNAKKLKYEKLDNGIIVFKSSITGLEVWRIPAPFMIDAAGNKSKDVHFNLSEKDGVIYGQLIADKEWLSSKDRQFPVFLDPSFEAEYPIQPDINDGLDTYISTDEGSNVDNSLEKVLYASDFVNDYDYSNIVERSLFKFTKVGDIPSDAKIKYAKMSFHGFLKVYEDGELSENGETNLYLREITSDWDPFSVRWENQPSTNEDSLQASHASAGDDKWVTFDTTDTVSKWVNDPKSNKGFMLAISHIKNNYFGIDSCESDNSDNRPLLDVYYETTTPDPPVIGNLNVDNSGNVTVFGYGEPGSNVTIKGNGITLGHATVEYDTGSGLASGEQIYILTRVLNIKLMHMRKRIIK